MSIINAKYAKANEGDIIKIIQLAPNSDGRKDSLADSYVGRIGKVEYIDDLGILHGTWGSLGILPQDIYQIIKFSPK